MHPVTKLAVIGLVVAASLGAGERGSVVGVFPSGPTVPENLLRLSVAFDKQPPPGVLKRLSLSGASGSSGQPVFLDQELWSPDGRTLTVLLDPGRVKTGTVANERFGRALRTGTEVRLTLDGSPIKSWHVSAPITADPTPSLWTIKAPRVGSRNPIVVSLVNPIDHLDREMIAVASPDGQRLGGTVELDTGEQVWRFTPDMAWRPGGYAIMVNPDLEDPAGNSVGQSFEFVETPLPSGHARPVSLPFVVHQR